MWTFYPWYHAERPRFFNQATLYLDIIRALKFNLAAYIKYVSLLMWSKESPVNCVFKELASDEKNFFDAIDIFKFAYDSYVEWESKGGVDLLLGANRLTNRQLFWMALARSRYQKQKNDFYGKSDYDKTLFYSHGRGLCSLWLQDPKYCLVDLYLGRLEELESFKEAFSEIDNEKHKM